MNFTPVVRTSRPPDFADLATQGILIPNDWSGRILSAPVRVLFWIDGSQFHFLAESLLGPGLNDPSSNPSNFHAGLWRFDVCEFFLSVPASDHYLEFNLAPNGAWWSCRFSALRQPASHEPSPIPGVTTRAEQTPSSWKAHASLPLSWLEDHYNFGEKSGLNATLILKSPDQIFLTAGAPAEGDPDFHRPHAFPKVKFRALA